ncbi:STAS domain-containing protein [Pseudonocardia phyllosphaerae]|uniref:STAS domain-containing protein n=1 Tax=Pseudonocardia phyllosphaerae TaxID=3390502 RepID=UPI00397B7737
MSDPRELSLTWSRPQAGVVAVRLAGALDYDTVDALTEDVRQLLDAEAGRISELRLDCADLAFCDSTGLSSLLMIRRDTARNGVELVLDRRSGALDRLLRVTNTLAYLVGGSARTREEQFDT